jgi:hypothetical protein
MDENFSRPCPVGSYRIAAHPRQVSKSSRNPDGITAVKGHCRKNPSKHEVILPDELRYIEEKYFKKNENLPSPHKLKFKRDLKVYDQLIGGWVKFWNDQLKPKVPLDPDIVKALVASESGFNSKAKVRSNDGMAIGLMQVTEGTLKILGSDKGELKNFLLKISDKDLKDPSINIAAGVRWLFRKKETAKARLKREATWIEVIEEYKGVLNQENKKKETIMRKFNEYLSLLKLGRP